MDATTSLLAWYDRHARQLPWRSGPRERAAGHRPDPYRVWLSEIMLQQTTVAAVKPYFEAFVGRWPRVQDLAAADTAEVMSAWAGLGYYARARNLVACARRVAQDHGGRFPGTAAELRALPGIGEYTSAAIAAIAFDESVAVVDGNVERVISRLYAIETPLPAAKPEIRRRAADLTLAERPGDFAQAMMDLGATICTPKRPACILCPVAEGCLARDRGTQALFPVKRPKAAKPSRRGAAFVAIRRADGAIWLRRRPDSGMLGGMAEPPTTAWSARQDGAEDATSAPFPATWRAIGSASHGFTHFDLDLTVWRAEITFDPAVEGWWAPPETLAGEALPTLMKKVVTVAVPDAFVRPRSAVRSRTARRPSAGS
ncbi:A/G-specific adenine glycosylase [Consotaella aegiceratis]|uniref:A/G-specific adenine glycosylase n=1 Tax=Consotaella aegiceratis TaxID=3097961 RepID=UPI002F408847